VAAVSCITIEVCKLYHMFFSISVAYYMHNELDYAMLNAKLMSLYDLHERAPRVGHPLNDKQNRTERYEYMYISVCFHVTTISIEIHTCIYSVYVYVVDFSGEARLHSSAERKEFTGIILYYTVLYNYYIIVLEIMPHS
jgi:hypothetical protein